MKKEKKDQIIRRISEQSMLKLTPMPYGTGWMTPTNDRREKYFALTDGMFSKYLCDKENIHRIWKTTNFLISDSPQGTYRGFQSLTL
jgi:hypothetical protein